MPGGGPGGGGSTPLTPGGGPGGGGSTAPTPGGGPGGGGSSAPSAHTVCCQLVKCEKQLGKAARSIYSQRQQHSIYVDR